MLIQGAPSLPALRAWKPAAAVASDGFAPSAQEPAPPDLRAAARLLTRNWVAPVPRTHASPHTNLRGGMHLDEAGVAHLTQGASILRIAPDGRPLEPAALPGEPGAGGVRHDGDGTIFYLSGTGRAVAVREGNVLFDHPVGTASGAIERQPDGNFLACSEQTVKRLAPDGQELGSWTLPVEGKLVGLACARDGSFYARTSAGNVVGCGPDGGIVWQKSFKGFGLHASLQLSDDQKTLSVNGLHKLLLDLDTATGEPTFQHPIGKAEGYWSCSSWVPLRDGQRAILTQGGKILRFDAQGRALDPIDTGVEWGQINGSNPMLERSGENLFVMPSVSRLQIYGLDGARRADYKCGELFHPSAYYHAAAVRDGHVAVAAGSFHLATLDLPASARCGDERAGSVQERQQSVLVGGINLRKRS